jgi:hypothetical protein
MNLQLIKKAGIKQIAKATGKRVGKDYLVLLEEHIRRKVEAACRVHNGGKKTIDASIAAHTL